MRAGIVCALVPLVPPHLVAAVGELEYAPGLASSVLLVAGGEEFAGTAPDLDDRLLELGEHALLFVRAERVGDGEGECA
jgi:hypothetical protein